jgi:hypothetical protein
MISIEYGVNVIDNITHLIWADNSRTIWFIHCVKKLRVVVVILNDSGQLSRRIWIPMSIGSVCDSKPRLAEIFASCKSKWRWTSNTIYSGTYKKSHQEMKWNADLDYRVDERGPKGKEGVQECNRDNKSRPMSSNRNWRMRIQWSSANLSAYACVWPCRKVYQLIWLLTWMSIL